MRTTLTIEDDIAVRIEQLRRYRQTSFKTIINEALRLGMKEMEKPARPGRPFKTKSVSLGKCLIGNIDDIGETLAVAEGEEHK
jgi:hypothetical protein